MDGIEIFDLLKNFAGVERGHTLRRIARASGVPRIDGFTIGVWDTDRPAPHGGEMHPDGDEFLFVVSGEVAVEHYGDSGTTVAAMQAGEGCIVPRGVWHKVIPKGACRILFATPGPRIELRPPRTSTS